MANDYSTDGEVDEYLTQLILKARQAGIFFIVAMQRPDGEFLKTALRDQFMFRMSVGRLSETGILMIFGDENKNKKFKYVEKLTVRKSMVVDMWLKEEELHVNFIVLKYHKTLTSLKNLSKFLKS